MTSHFKLYDGMGEVIPFNARYAYPTQANRASKSVIKIPPKNGATFKSTMAGAPIRIEFPAQGYMNCRNSSLVFDLILDAPTGIANGRIQNNIQSIFRRVRLVYGSLPLEDIRDYNVIVRKLTEGAGTNTTGIIDQTAISEGIGGSVVTPAACSTEHLTRGEKKSEVLIPANVAINSRLLHIQSSAFHYPTMFPDNNPNGINSQPGYKAGNLMAYNADSVAILADATHAESTPRSRRYQVQLALGVFQQNKLLPLKWMASQLTLELELCPLVECFAHMMYDNTSPVSINTSNTGYTLTNIAYLAELLEFDGSYDAAFLEGLRGEGVPIKFSSWDTFNAVPSPSTRQTIMVPERNRSLKAAFCVLRPNPRMTTDKHFHPCDSHAFLQSSTVDDPGTGFKWTAELGVRKGWLKSFQWRIGGKYYPAQPVDCGMTASNGATEAYFEFAKALNIVGDYRLSTGIHPARWSRCNGTGSAFDHWSSEVDWNLDVPHIAASKDETLFGFYNGTGPSCFVVAADFETSGGAEVSGLNGEEQNDIALNLEYSSVQDPQCIYDVFVYYDALLVLRENNLVELIK